MKKIAEALISFRVTPTVGFKQEDGKYKFIPIDPENKTSLLEQEIHGLGIVCGQDDMFALKVSKPDYQVIESLYEKLGVKKDYKWIAASSNNEMYIFLKIYSAPSEFRDRTRPFELQKTNGSFMHVTRGGTPLIVSNLFGVNYSLANGDITTETPPYEVDFPHLINVLSEFMDVKDYQKQEPSTEAGAVKDDHIETPILPLRILEKLPDFLKKYLGQFRLPREKDISLLSLIAAISACLPNIISRHRNKKIWAHLYVVITAPPASGKGVVAEVIRIVQRIEKTFRETYELELREYKRQLKLYKNGEIEDEPIQPVKKTIQLPTDTSFIALFQQLVNNGESGLMFETEIDSFVNAGKQEWGNYSLLNRKATHHEPHLVERKDKSLSVEAPKIAMVMTGTPNQFFKLFPSAEDGLYSRFLIYCFQLKQINLLNPYVSDHEHFFDDIVEESSNFIYSLFHSLSELPHEIEFQWNSKQGDALYQYFSKMLSTVSPMYGENSASVLLRYMLAATRIGMVLTAIEEYEKGNLLDRKSLQPGDHIVEIVKQIIDTSFQHSLLMLANIEANSKNKPVEMKSLNILRFLNALPERKSFKTNEAIEIGKSVKVSPRSVGDYLIHYATPNIWNERATENTEG